MYHISGQLFFGFIFACESMYTFWKKFSETGHSSHLVIRLSSTLHTLVEKFLVVNEMFCYIFCLFSPFFVLVQVMLFLGKKK